MPNTNFWKFVITKVKPLLSLDRKTDKLFLGTAIVADTPIAKASDDLLGRTTMADRIAQILAASGGADGRVFAIRGAWGFGKSSLKNLVIETLSEKHHGVAVLDFNPWQWGDNDSIARTLFTQMAGKLGGSHAPNPSKRARVLRRYGKLITVGTGGLDKFGHNTAELPRCSRCRRRRSHPRFYHIRHPSLDGRDRDYRFWSRRLHNRWSTKLDRTRP